MSGYDSRSSAADNALGAYVTYARKEDAAKCIHAVDGTVHEGRMLRYARRHPIPGRSDSSFIFSPKQSFTVIKQSFVFSSNRASYGTTKYCTYYLRGLNCQNPGCMYLHEPGEEADSYTKEEMAVGKHHAKIHPNLSTGQLESSNFHVNSSALGPAAPFGPNAGGHLEEDVPKVYECQEMSNTALTPIYRHEHHSQDHLHPPPTRTPTNGPLRLPRASPIPPPTRHCHVVLPGPPVYPVVRQAVAHRLRNHLPPQPSPPMATVAGRMQTCQRTFPREPRTMIGWSARCLSKDSLSIPRIPLMHV